MDWLSRLLNIAPVTGRLELRCLYGAPWEIVYQPSPAGEMPYHVVLGGSAFLDGEGDAPAQELKAGDIVLLTRGSAHVLRDGSGAKPGRVKERENHSVIVSENSGRGERLDLLCGRFVMAPHHERLVSGYLPSTLIVRGTSPESPAALATQAQLTALVGMMRAESLADSLGGQAMLNALSAALFTLALRVAGESDRAPTGLLAAAGHARLAPALEAMLKDPAHPWSLPEIAGLCNMSRATAARHFQNQVGRSARDLLVDIRMGIAANELKQTALSTDAIAEKVGYQSINAFRLAFRQRMGVSPADWRRSGAATGG